MEKKKKSIAARFFYMLDFALFAVPAVLLEFLWRFEKEEEEDDEEEEEDEETGRRRKLLSIRGAIGLNLVPVAVVVVNGAFPVGVIGVSLMRLLFSCSADVDDIDLDDDVEVGTAKSFRFGGTDCIKVWCGIGDGGKV